MTIMLNLRVNSLEALHLPASHTIGQLASTLDFIPGTALRGALAAEYQRRQGVDAFFERLFLDEGGFYGSLLPLGPAETPLSPVIPAPATAYTCKLMPGFVQDGRKHGVRDMLFTFLEGTRGEASERCQMDECGAALIPFQGFLAGRPGSYQEIKINKRFITRTAIDSRRETAAAEQLFTLEVLEEGQAFGGTIRLADSALEKRLLDCCLSEDFKLRIGAARTRGHGCVQVVRAEVQSAALPGDLSTLEDLAERLRVFHQRAATALPEPPKGTLFSLTLLSDCLLLDDYLRYRSQMTPSDLARWIHPALEQALPKAAFCQVRTLDGWSAVQRLPRDQALAIQAGGVFVFETALPLDQLQAHLAHAERNGLGERRLEGFGRVAACHPFHHQEQQQ